MRTRSTGPSVYEKESANVFARVVRTVEHGARGRSWCRVDLAGEGRGRERGGPREGADGLRLVEAVIAAGEQADRRVGDERSVGSGALVAGNGDRSPGRARRGSRAPNGRDGRRRARGGGRGAGRRLAAGARDQARCRWSASRSPPRLGAYVSVTVAGVRRVPVRVEGRSALRWSICVAQQVLQQSGRRADRGSARGTAEDRDRQRRHPGSIRK